MPENSRGDGFLRMEGSKVSNHGGRSLKIELKNAHYFGKKHTLEFGESHFVEVPGSGWMAGCGVRLAGKSMHRVNNHHSKGFARQKDGDRWE